MWLEDALVGEERDVDRAEPIHVLLGHATTLAASQGRAIGKEGRSVIDEPRPSALAQP